MRKFKKLFFILVTLGMGFFVFAPAVFSDDLTGRNFLDSVSTQDKDAIIIFNSGGWGNTPIERAKDFLPIIDGIENKLIEKGYNPTVISFNRVKKGFLGRMTAVKDWSTSFYFSSETLLKDVELVRVNFPDKKIILAGLSSGAVVTDETMKKINRENIDSVYAVAVGSPFWHKIHPAENILELNKNNDSLSQGDVKFLSKAFFGGLSRWFSAKIKGEDLTFSRSFHFIGHDYTWEEIGPQIDAFLDVKLENRYN